MECSKKIKELRESTGMNRKEFCEYFDIPYRTVTEWERGNRHAPEYVWRLLEYHVKGCRSKNKIIRVQDIPITISETDKDDYICITDMAAAKRGNSRAADVVKNWIRNRMTLEFLGTWEQIYNPEFKVVEFDHFKSQAGLHTFVLSVSER